MDQIYSIVILVNMKFDYSSTQVHLNIIDQHKERIIRRSYQNQNENNINYNNDKNTKNVIK